MSLFGCAHVYGSWGKKQNGYQIKRCKKCGKTRKRRVSQIFCMHRWRKDRRRKATILTCKKCARQREVVKR